ncbi:MAG: hypothetical protein Q8O19_05520, partial [Rectinemataceae bacterium]|nr:hypothetical protein [Rectinemataceae bacterium]
AAGVVQILNRFSQDTGTWKSLVSGNTLTLSSEWRGVAENHTLDESVIKLREAQELHAVASSLQSLFSDKVTFLRKSEEISSASPSTLYHAIMELGKKGMGLQRFKGLGEMNAVQLWDTTLNPQTRTLLKVTVGQAEEAENIFNTLMGEVVEPRRDFIVKNALKVVNLDV